MKAHRVAALAVGFALIASACTSSVTGSDDAPSILESNEDEAGSPGTVSTEPQTASTETQTVSTAQPAPEFPAGLDWLNVARPLSLAELRGKVVLLDFWTYGCVNCMHVIPDLKRLEEQYPDEFVVIGVHSAKFENEAETENIRSVIARYDLEHPVVNDRDFVVWRTWGVQAWPTLVLIDPDGNIVGGHSGEGIYPIFQPVIDSLVEEFDRRGRIDRTPLDLVLEKDALPASVLSFPGKVLADSAGRRLFVADTNHHRVLVTDLDTGEVLEVAGSGLADFADGAFSAAAFDQPQGMALGADGRVLYVADTGNHSIRALDLVSRTVSTIIGTGRQASIYPPQPGAAPGVELSSPWDLARSGDALFIAMAGSHQIWSLDLSSGVATWFAGNGRESTANGPRLSAELAQPSGVIVLSDGRVVFADSESSSIRYADPGVDGVTGVLAGSDANLFDFGDVDGVGTAARLQHPLGVEFAQGVIWVADTYNSKIKRLDPDSAEITEFAGGEQGWADGIGGAARFSEPGGISHAEGMLYVADTNNHAVRIVDLATGEVATRVLYGIERFPSAALGTPPVVTLPGVEVAPGDGEVLLFIFIPDGYKVNDLAPFSMTWDANGVALIDGDRSIVDPRFPLAVAATFSSSGLLAVDLTVYYCTVEADQLCLIEQVRLELPFSVAGGGAATATLEYSIADPGA